MRSTILGKTGVVRIIIGGGLERLATPFIKEFVS
jgi:hypothetical protein